MVWRLRNYIQISMACAIISGATPSKNRACRHREATGAALVPDQKVIANERPNSVARRDVHQSLLQLDRQLVEFLLLLARHPPELGDAMTEPFDRYFPRDIHLVVGIKDGV